MAEPCSAKVSEGLQSDLRQVLCWHNKDLPTLSMMGYLTHGIETSNPSRFIV